jgi:hypothetical protein
MCRLDSKSPPQFTSSHCCYFFILPDFSLSGHLSCLFFGGFGPDKPYRCKKTVPRMDVVCARLGETAASIRDFWAINVPPQQPSQTNLGQTLQQPSMPAREATMTMFALGTTQSGGAASLRHPAVHAVQCLIGVHVPLICGFLVFQNSSLTPLEVSRCSDLSGRKMKQDDGIT